MEGPSIWQDVQPAGCSTCMSMHLLWMFNKVSMHLFWMLNLHVHTKTCKVLSYKVLSYKVLSIGAGSHMWWGQMWCGVNSGAGWNMVRGEICGRKNWRQVEMWGGAKCGLGSNLRRGDFLRRPHASVSFFRRKQRTEVCPSGNKGQRKHIPPSTTKPVRAVRAQNFLSAGSFSQIHGRPRNSGLSFPKQRSEVSARFVLPSASSLSPAHCQVREQSWCS